MTNAIFKEWILHFLLNVSKEYGIFQTNRHLLILDGHKSHVSLGVIKVAMARGLDILTFPSHTSHALQPLDLTYFKSFKMCFRAYRDKWTVAHSVQFPIIEDLAQLVSHDLRIEEHYLKRTLKEDLKLMLMLWIQRWDLMRSTVRDKEKNKHKRRATQVLRSQTLNYNSGSCNKF